MTEDRSLVVFANLASGGVLELGMSGGDRIAIECLKRWTHAFGRILVITTLAGREMYVRNDLRGVDYVISTRLVLPKHSLLNNVALQVLTAVKSSIAVSRLLKHQSGSGVILYSTSDFLGDFLPVLAGKILKPRTIWLAGFFLFAPSPFSPRNPYRGISFFRGALWHIAQVPILKLLKLFADVVFVTNELDKGKFTDAKRLAGDRVIAVRGGVDLSLLQEVPDSPVKTYDAVFVGRLHPQKGILELAKIWKLVCTQLPQARLAVIGNGELEDELRKRIVEYGLTRNVDLLGFVDGKKKIEIFRSSKIVLHPAVYDSGGMAAAEAMACGLPGIGFDLPALKNYYPRGMIKTPCFDLHKFAKSVLQLLDNGVLYDKLKCEAVEMLKDWDWNSRAEKLLDAVLSAESNQPWQSRHSLDK